MKRLIIQSCVACATVFSFAIGPARAQVFYEPFNYAVGSLNNGLYNLSWPTYNWWAPSSSMPQAVLGPGPVGGYGYFNQYGVYQFTFPQGAR